MGHKTPAELFAEKKLVRISAPMVRYSKLQFRTLVRRYNTDIAYTPMIVSDSFVKSQKARDSEFTTTAADRPLVVQFATNNAKDFADATEYVSRYADAVDLNCGCPQRWAMAEGYGSHLIKHPELVCDIVKTTWQRTNVPVSIKIRIHNDPKLTVEMARRAEMAGIQWLTVHGRTPDEKNSPVHYDVIKMVKDALSIPVVANGDVFTDRDAVRIQEITNCNGVMAARGLLSNPALFAGFESIPLECVQDWVDINIAHGADALLFQKTLVYMLDGVVSNTEHGEFARLTSVAACLDYLARYGIHYRPDNPYVRDQGMDRELKQLYLW